MSARSRSSTLEESQSILTAILEKSDDAIIRSNLEGEIVDWSQGASRLYGYSAEEIIGSPIGMLIPKDGGEESARMLEQVRAGVPLNHHETVRRAKDGRLIQVLLSMLPVTDEKNHVVGAFSITRDLTALKRAEADHRLRYSGPVRCPSGAEATSVHRARHRGHCRASHLSRRLTGASGTSEMQFGLLRLARDFSRDRRKIPRSTARAFRGLARRHAHRTRGPTVHRLLAGKNLISTAEHFEGEHHD